MIRASPSVMVMAAAALMGSSCAREKTTGLTSPAAGVYAQVCAACHGPNGEGKEELHSPSIAGLPVWYVEEQVEKFRDGWRGFHPEDLPGQQMRGIALTLTEAQISEAAATVAVMPVRMTEAPPAGFDLETARFRYANECMACHRYNGRGEIVFHSAPLVSLNRSYLRRQLFNYRSGLRGSIGSDVYGIKMASHTQKLSDSEIGMLVDYIGALARGDDPRAARER